MGTQFPLNHDSCRQPQTYVKPEAAIRVLCSWWWAVCRSKHVEQLSNIGIINSTTRLHLVGYFYKLYVMMHGHMKIKFIVTHSHTTTIIIPPEF